VSALQPLPSELQHAAPALQQSEEQQLEPSVQQLESALHTAPSLQQLAVLVLQQEAEALVMLHFCLPVCVSVAAYTTPVIPRTRVIAIALIDFIIMSPVSLESCRYTSRYTTGVFVHYPTLKQLNQECTAAQVGSAAIEGCRSISNKCRSRISV
jgi:hypothetical protein